MTLRVQLRDSYSDSRSNSYNDTMVLAIPKGTAEFIVFPVLFICSCVRRLGKPRLSDWKEKLGIQEERTKEEEYPKEEYPKLIS